MEANRTWGRRSVAIGAAIVLAALVGLAGWRLAVGWHPSADDYPVQGVDVDRDAGALDWATIRAGGADFAYIQATSGSAGRDPTFAANWSAAYAAGLRRGAVHRFALCRPAAEQAKNFIVVVPRVADALPAAVAVEEGADCAAPPSRQTLTAELARFAAMVERHTGKPIILQVAPAIESRYQLAAALDRSLWATRDYFAPSYLGRPWQMWRANAARRIDGAERPVGWDVVAP